jgi:DNA topoisomerase-1
VDEVFTIGMNRAVEVLAAKQTRGRAAAAAPLRELGDHPGGGAIQVMNGRYGPYVKWEKVNATLPRDVSPEDLTVEQALELIAAKAGKSPAKKKAAPKAKAAAKKPAAKKAPAKKATKKAAGG